MTIDFCPAEVGKWFGQEKDSASTLVQSGKDIAPQRFLPVLVMGTKIEEPWGQVRDSCVSNEEGLFRRGPHRGLSEKNKHRVCVAEWF